MMLTDSWKDNYCKQYVTDVFTHRLFYGQDVGPPLVPLSPDWTVLNIEHSAWCFSMGNKDRDCFRWRMCYRCVVSISSAHNWSQLQMTQKTSISNSILLFIPWSVVPLSLIWLEQTFPISLMVTVNDWSSSITLPTHAASTSQENCREENNFSEGWTVSHSHSHRDLGQKLFGVLTLLSERRVLLGIKTPTPFPKMS